LCNLPSKTDRFFGREKELREIKDELEIPSDVQRKLVLRGISGSGKSQLVLEYIAQRRECFSAILWINASSIEQSFAFCAIRINQEFPQFKDPAKHDGPRSVVLDWLQATRHPNWLLVIDGVDDLIRDKNLLESVRDLGRGAVCVTSTHPSTEQTIKAKLIPIQHLDSAASQSLLLWRAFGTDQDPGEDGK
jgi:hypothetical protein